MDGLLCYCPADGEVRRPFDNVGMKAADKSMRGKWGGDAKWKPRRHGTVRAYQKMMCGGLFGVRKAMQYAPQYLFVCGGYGTHAQIVGVYAVDRSVGWEVQFVDRQVV